MIYKKFTISVLDQNFIFYVKYSKSIFRHLYFQVELVSNSGKLFWSLYLYFSFEKYRKVRGFNHMMWLKNIKTNLHSSLGNLRLISLDKKIQIICVFFTRKILIKFCGKINNPDKYQTTKLYNMYYFLINFWQVIYWFAIFTEKYNPNYSRLNFSAKLTTLLKICYLIL